MSVSGSELPIGDDRIEWAQAHSAREVLDRDVRLAKPDPQPTAEKPSHSQVGVEQERPINKIDPSIEIADNKGERPSSR
jgi:hypothetical protein